MRANIRLKYALAADKEIYETIPELENMIDTAIAMGQTFELDPAVYLLDVEDEDEVQD